MEVQSDTVRHRNQLSSENDEEIQPSIQPLLEQKDWLPQQTRLATKAALLMLFFSLLMFTIPFLVFFATRYYALEHFHLDFSQSNALAVFAAVVSVNIIIGVYAYIAYKEPDYDSEGNLIDEDKSLKVSKEQLELKKE